MNRSVASLKRAVEEGRTYVSIARDLGITDEAVRQLVRAHGLFVPRQSRWTATMVRELIELHATGLSMSKIGERIGIGKGAVTGKCRRLKLPARPRICVTTPLPTTNKGTNL